jgi:hypothetical protein
MPNAKKVVIRLSNRGAPGEWITRHKAVGGTGLLHLLNVQLKVGTNFPSKALGINIAVLFGNVPHHQTTLFIDRISRTVCR